MSSMREGPASDRQRAAEILGMAFIESASSGPHTVTDALYAIAAALDRIADVIADTKDLS